MAPRSRPRASRTQKDGSVRIDAVIYVARAGHKAILIGAKGARIKDIGARARRELSQLLECNVHLFLRVNERAGLGRGSRADPRDGAERSEELAREGN